MQIIKIQLGTPIQSSKNLKEIIIKVFKYTYSYKRIPRFL
jgi:hypothetical protein